MKTKTHLFSKLLVTAMLALPAAVQAQLIFTTNNGAITITGYNGSPGIVVIPSTTNGYPVTKIWDNAFKRQTLASVTIPNSVTHIGISAFDSCAGLTNVAIGNSVSNIEQSAFSFCTRLASVTIPSSVTNIGNNAFTGCAKLVAITVNPTNSYYSSTNGVLFNKNKTTLVKYPPAIAGGSYTIPNSVTNIGINAFYRCSSLTSVIIPNSVTYIGLGAFYECTSLNNVTIGTNVITIWTQAFQGCNLTSVTIPNSVHTIGNSVFYLCSSLTNVTIGTNVAIIYNNIFLDCSGLTGIYFLGNAPSSLYSDFDYDDNTATVYYLPWTTGWPTPGTLFGGCPTALWLPQSQTSAASFGVQTNQFGFNITWASDLVVVVEACTNLANPVWSPVGTNTLTGGSSYFSDPQWQNYPGRFYRLRSP